MTVLLEMRSQIFHLVLRNKNASESFIPFTEVKEVECKNSI